MGKKRKPTVWEALNEPIIHVSEEQGKKVIFAAVLIMSAAWVAPYWSQAGNVAYAAETTIFEDMAMIPEAYAYEGGRVAGISITPLASPLNLRGEVPEWYLVLEEIPDAVAQSFSAGANEVLDISAPVTTLAEFYQPGVDEVWTAWLNLMRDPGTAEF